MTITKVLPLRDARSLRFEYLPSFSDDDGNSSNALGFFDRSGETTRFCSVVAMAVGKERPSDLARSAGDANKLEADVPPDEYVPSYTGNEDEKEDDLKNVKKRRRSNVVEKFRKVSESV